MSNKQILDKLKIYHRKIKGSTIEYDLKPYQSVCNKVNALKTNFENKSDDELKEISQLLKEKALNNESKDDLLIEAFALVREVVWRVLKICPHDVQIIGAVVMHYGKLAEMRTGEGKTLTAVFPAYLNALSAKGVHVLTFNDYLAKRDAEWMGPIYNFLGLSVDYIQEKMTIKDRQIAYNADITYLSAKESGFDYLRDSLCIETADCVHRNLNYAIIDEADSILIDEARIPLIIAGSSDDHISDTFRLAQISHQLKIDKDIEIDEYGRNIYLTEEGIKWIEDRLNCGDLHNKKNIELLTRLNCAIHAEFLLLRDMDYIVRNGKIELVDEFTGRIADKRRWPDGLQAALEAKENISVQSKGNILNSITLQHFLGNYSKLSGMTATAQAAEREFREFYNLSIVVIPPDKPCVRIDHQDKLYKTKEAKQKALVQEIIRVNRTKQPVLVGTHSVQESESLASVLQEYGVKCAVLNAKRDEFEAKIIADAGRLDAVTISTNMAGRGTDIRLGGKNEKEKQLVSKLGGLYVIGTNRHESLRIDDQLRGRAGRQGDPGSSRFFISLEDHLYVKYKLEDLLPANFVVDEHTGQIDNPIVKFEINRIQRIIEGQNLEIKKTLFKYSSIIEKQRMIIFTKRKNVLMKNTIPDKFSRIMPKKFDRLFLISGKDKFNDICRKIFLYHSDRSWSEYIAQIADIREGIHFRKLGGQNPVFEFQKLAVKIFSEMEKTMEHDIIRSFKNIKVKNGKIDISSAGLKTPSATWTYLINDNFFENMLGAELLGNIGLSIGAGMLAPLMLVFQLYRKFKRENRKSVAE
ncbi:accessory Sec system translocase SecA2 [candidate division KSB1 bacterium]